MRPYLPSAGQSVVAAGDVAVLPWNNVDAVRRYLEGHASETAALIMEPILCNTSVILPRPGYLEGVRELCDRHGVVLIFDEVITGFRVGLSGAQGRFGVTPDLAVFAKALAGGFPIGAVAGKRKIMELMGYGSVLHGGSFNGHNASIAAGLATLDALSSEGVYEQMEARGDALVDGIRQVAHRADIPFLVHTDADIEEKASGCSRHRLATPLLLHRVTADRADHSSRRVPEKTLVVTRSWCGLRWCGLRTPRMRSLPQPGLAQAVPWA